ncbi:hypothetical protein PM3016_1715 [Paenibacillus mucilaginosus 3016]|uniref:DUF3500 domain-containing protein n=1 Tax=Paenibacillus mucilaginosus 3016 TaxID=1116391 RepID=H6NET8_9BACL|nr:DUF3500 domain-containing protein [Paenibacillus mucilaginosus]AFC28629.1 hypothetical protein PM3016_1715 [Paenibacillus mucilaginosus 3016]WFA17408.1 DUF3500 domain-containing protein [Paenibacillus mucilaginosus]
MKRKKETKTILMAVAMSLVMSACANGAISTTAGSGSTTADTTAAASTAEGTTAAPANAGPGGGPPPDGQGGPGGGPGGPGGEAVDTTTGRVTDVAAAVKADAVTGSTACSSSAETDAAVACLADAFLKTLTDEQKEAVQFDLTAENGAVWSNLPAGNVKRNGLMFGTLSTESLEAVKALAAEALSGTGYSTLRSIILADEYLTTDTGNTMWDADLYYIAFLGTPSATEPWVLQISGHHYAANLSFNMKTDSATPMFVGVEPQTFTMDGVTYEPLAARRDAMYTMLGSLSAEQQKTATISGKFDDVLVGPGQDGNFPAKEEGILYTELDDSQKALVKASIEAWVKDANEELSQELLSAYLSEEALSQTYIGWSGSTSYADHGSYIRISGPRVWIEFVCQTGVAYKDQIHFHTIWRDKLADYGGSFSS